LDPQVCAPFPKAAAPQARGDPAALCRAQLHARGQILPACLPRSAERSYTLEVKYSQLACRALPSAATRSRSNSLSLPPRSAERSYTIQVKFSQLACRALPSAATRSRSNSLSLPAALCRAQLHAPGQILPACLPRSAERSYTLEVKFSQVACRALPSAATGRRGTRTIRRSPALLRARGPPRSLSRPSMMAARGASRVGWDR